MLFTAKIHRFFFLFGIALAICSLPYSPFTLSVGIFTISINWLLDGNWVAKYQRFSTNKSLWVFFLVYFSIAISFFYSENIIRAITELKIWVPLLVIPIVLSTSDSLKKYELKLLLILFCISLFITTIVSIRLYLHDFSNLGQNVRYLSPYILHIRLALMIDLAVLALGYMAFKKGFFNNLLIKILLVILAVWFIVFLFILQSLTGIVILFTVTTIILVWWIFFVKNIVAKYSMIVGVSLIILLLFSYLAHTVDNYFARKPIDFKNLPRTTVNGNTYFHDTLSCQYENGHLVWINICQPEFEREWAKVSKLPIDGKDKSGQLIKLTAIRYLTSKGLSKDSVGISKLDSIDVRLIENSVSSIIYREHKAGLYPRFYQLLWEIDTYKTRNVISGSSIIQRYIFIKTSWSVIKDNFILGVGIGDVKDTLFNHFKTSEISQNPESWRTPHNQYLTVWLASGILGLAMFLAGLLFPFLIGSKYKEFLPFVFLVIIILSMFSIETFEKHIGASFVALFYSILIFGYDFEDNKVNDK